MPNINSIRYSCATDSIQQIQQPPETKKIIQIKTDTTSVPYRAVQLSKHCILRSFYLTENNGLVGKQHMLEIHALSSIGLWRPRVKIWDKG